MWLFIWALLALFILGFFVWSTFTLYEQKRAWKEFAKEFDLTYDPGKFLGAPALRGRLQGMRFNLFSGAQDTEDIRGQRFLTIVEFELGSGMKTQAAIGTEEMKFFIDSLSYTEAYKPNDKNWNEDYIVRTNDTDILKAYLTPERIKLLNNIFKMNNSVAIFLFDKIEAVLRIETADPLANRERMTKVIKGLVSVCKKLSPDPDDMPSKAEVLEAEKEKAAAEDKNAKASEQDNGDNQEDSPSEKNEDTQSGKEDQSSQTESDDKDADNSQDKSKDKKES